MEKKWVVATVFLVATYVAQSSACCCGGMGMFDGSRLPVSTWECILYIKNVLKNGDDVKEHLLQREICYPLHVVASAAETDLVEPLVQHGYSLVDKNEDGFSPLELTVGSSIMIGKQVEVVEEMFRVVPLSDYGTLWKQFCQRTVPETFNGSALFQRLQRVSEPNWRTKVWQGQFLAFLMAVHPRTGANSPARVLCECELPNFFQTIANLLPRNAKKS